MTLPSHPRPFLPIHDPSIPSSPRVIQPQDPGCLLDPQPGLVLGAQLLPPRTGVGLALELEDALGGAVHHDGEQAEDGPRLASAGGALGRRKEGILRDTGRL